MTTGKDFAQYAGKPLPRTAILRDPRTLARELTAGIVANGGATICPADRSTPTAGYSVSVPGGELRTVGVPAENVVLAWLESTAAPLFARELANGRRPYVGGWKDGDHVYLDVSIVIDDLTDAINTGREYKQLAIYSFAGSRTITFTQFDAKTGQC